MSTLFEERKAQAEARRQQLVDKPNQVDSSWYNGLYERFVDPVVTPEHTPLFWRYDLNPATNPHFLQRLGINATFNPGAIELDGKVHLIVRVEGDDRKSFFAVAESENGVDQFRFWDRPCVIPELDDPGVNIYDMRPVLHEDGWIYGVFCVERKDKNAPAGDTSAADAQCGIARTKDLVKWERLPDLKTPSPQQRNCVLHPEFVDGKYAWYTRPQDGFINAGSGGGIGFGLSDKVDPAVIEEENIIDERLYHTIKEVKNGAGASPLKTDFGWIHFAHGVRATATGLRYVCYAFLCDPQDPSKVIARPSGHFLAPFGEERIGDLFGLLFTNGAVLREDGTILLYYANCDTLSWVVRTDLERMEDYFKNTPEDPLYSHACVQQRIELIDRNLAL